jgi:hypothetical protein
VVENGNYGWIVCYVAVGIGRIEEEERGGG